MKKNLIYIIAVLLAAGIGSCKKILDRVDINGVSSTVIWNDPVVANLYLNNLYNLVIPVWPCDESAATLPTPIHNISDDANGTSNSSTARMTLAEAVRIADIGIRSKCASITLVMGTLAPQLAPTKIIAANAPSI